MTMISAPLTQSIPNKIMNFPLNHNKSFNRFYFKNIAIQENFRYSFYKAKRKKRTRIIYKTEVAIWRRKMKCSSKEKWI